MANSAEPALEFDELLMISEPHLVERYGKALASFGLKMPKLKKFQIDMIGYSPEIAKSLKNPDYLDPHRVNRRFIILTPEQENLPVVHSSFSNTRDLMAEFFEHNRRVLYALTIKDVVFGEIEDSLFKVRDIDDLLSIEQVEFKISSHAQLPEKTARLKSKIDRLLKEPEAWRDDQLIQGMVDLARETGDIRDNELLPEEVFFRHESYWSSHFGGIYIFHDGNQATVICDSSARGFRKSRPWQVSYIDIKDSRNIYRFLEESGRLEPPRGSWIERSGLLDMRLHMVAVMLADAKGDALPENGFDKKWSRQWISENRTMVGEEGTIPLLLWVESQIEDWSTIDVRDVEDDWKFAICRADPEHPDFELVNRLISDFLPYDFITRFEFNQPNFAEDKQAWSKNYAGFVAEVLNNYYLPKHDSLFERLYL